MKIKDNDVCCLTNSWYEKPTNMFVDSAVKKEIHIEDTICDNASEGNDAATVCNCKIECKQLALPY